jgi:hypothetical protein
MPSADGLIEPGCPGCEKLRALLNDALLRLAVAEKRLEELEREAHRQAAPFRRPEKKRKQDKGKPGRRKGHPPAHREPPPQVDEYAEVPLARCPQCAGPVANVRPVAQVIEDIPVVVTHHLHLTTYRGECPHCGPVHSTHPAQVSTAAGAAGVHLGRNALALAASLNKGHGLPLRKVCAILQDHFGLRLTPGGLSQALVRMAGKLQAPYQELRDAVRHSAVIHADETGWWVAGKSAWLWVFTNPQLTLYAIDNRSQEVVRRILGDDHAGVLVSDCLASYDPHPGRKSKCCAHHLKAIAEALEQAPDSAFLRNIRGLLKAAIMLHKLREDLAAERYEQSRATLERRLDELLEPPRGDPAEIKIRNRLSKHRPYLLTFLHVAGVDPTNNLAERQLRPAVIARKLSCGNKSEAGKAAFEVLASLAATCRQQGRSFTELVADGLSLGLSPPPLFAPD